MTLSTELNWGTGGVTLGMDGSGNAIAAWVGFYADASHYAVLRPAAAGVRPRRYRLTSRARRVT